MRFVFAGRSGRISLQTGGGGDPAGIGSADCRLHFWNRQRVSASAEDNLYDGITVSTDDRDRHSIDNLMHLKERKMTEGLYQWVENIAFYMVLMTAALHLIPGDGYRKYLKFFTGLLLILLVISPLLKVAGMEKTFEEVFQKHTYEEELRKIEEQTKYLKEICPEDYLPKDYGGNNPQQDRMKEEEIAEEREKEGGEEYSE